MGTASEERKTVNSPSTSRSAFPWSEESEPHPTPWKPPSLGHGNPLESLAKNVIAHAESFMVPAKNVIAHVEGWREAELLKLTSVLETVQSNIKDVQIPFLSPAEFGPNAHRAHLQVPLPPLVAPPAPPAPTVPQAVAPKTRRRWWLPLPKIPHKFRPRIRLRLGRGESDEQSSSRNENKRKAGHKDIKDLPRVEEGWFKELDASLVNERSTSEVLEELQRAKNRKKTPAGHVPNGDKSQDPLHKGLYGKSKVINGTIPPIEPGPPLQPRKTLQQKSVDVEVEFYGIPPPKSMEITVNRATQTATAAESATTVQGATDEGTWFSQDNLLLEQLEKDRLARHMRNLARSRGQMAQREEELAVVTALSVRSKQDALHFENQIGSIQLLRTFCSATHTRALKIEAATSLAQIIKLAPEIADGIWKEQKDAGDAIANGALHLVTDTRLPSIGNDRKLRPWRRKRLLGEGQREQGIKAVLSLVHVFLMAGDSSVKALQQQPKLVDCLKVVASGGFVDRPTGIDSHINGLIASLFRRQKPPALPPKLTSLQCLAHKMLAMLGASAWRPKTKGQKGIRVLCFDGGGTRGVLTIAMLQLLKKKLGREPHEVFDLIVGTSTGGIVAALCGLECYSLDKCAKLYDSLINVIFKKNPSSNLRLAVKQAFYDEENWMNILREVLGDRKMIDSKGNPDCPHVAFPSSIVSVNPPRAWLWRNYNYPLGSKGRYEGSFRHTVREALRSTTAAPTFFAPVLLNSVLYSDGAIICNNPCAIAYHEARHLFPGIPIEVVVSLGTGCFYEQVRDFSDPQVGWDGIINQLVSSATETENTNDIMVDLMPEGIYYRFNPRMTAMGIDETDSERLNDLKKLASAYFEEPEQKAILDKLVGVLNCTR